MDEPVAWIANDAYLPLKEDGSYWLYPENPSKDNLYIPLYTHQYERPHNTVLVPCDKLAEMQAEIEALKAEIVSIEKNTDYWADKANWIKNNKPVAWRCKKFYETQEGWFYNENEIGEPLYTHPHPDNLGFAESIIKQQQSEIERLIMLCDCMTTESNRKGNEIEELKAKLNKYHLKEDLDRNLDLIYGKEFIK